MRSLRKVHEVTHIPEILSASLRVLPVKLVLNVYLRYLVRLPSEFDIRSFPLKL